MPIQVLELTQKVCAVCRLLDGDIALKPCFYCSLCDSWICEPDSHKWHRRALAAIKRKLEPDFKGDPEYKIEAN